MFVFREKELLSALLVVCWKNDSRGSRLEGFTDRCVL